MDAMKFFACALALAGCSSNNESGGSPPTPAQQCTSVVDDLCSRLLACVPDAGSQSSCVSAGMQAVECSKVTSVKGSSSSCESDIVHDPCGTLLDAGVPSSCDGLFAQ